MLSESSSDNAIHDSGRMDYVDDCGSMDRRALWDAIETYGMQTHAFTPSARGARIGIARRVTDRGTEYCGRVDKHDYQLFLAINDIDHTRPR